MEMLDYLNELALSLEGTEASMPFGDGALVYKVGGKMFLLLSLDSSPLRFNAKCDPERAEELREQYEGITPGFHMNKKHWNTIDTGSGIPVTLIKELVLHSYDLVKPRGRKLVKTKDNQ